MSHLQIPKRCIPLVRKLGDGPNCSEPPFIQSAFAQSDYAVVFGKNAEVLVHEPIYVDFSVPGALYLLRHSCELWLKCLLGNVEVDSILKAIASGVQDLEILSRPPVAMHVRKKNALKSFVAALRRALCVIHNVYVRNLTYPACWKLREDDDPVLGMRFLRQHPSLPRSRFADLFVPMLDGHSLSQLWRDARQIVDDLHAEVRRSEDDPGEGDLLTLDELDQIVTLLEWIDPSGTTLRYPYALDGSWHAPPLRMDAGKVGDLARRFGGTVKAFREYREQGYTWGASVSEPDGWMGWEEP